MATRTSQSSLPPMIADDRTGLPAVDRLAVTAQEEVATVVEPSAAADDFTRSEFQPGSATGHRGVFVTHWAMAVTRTRAEMLVVSQLAYWLGVSKKGHLRAKICREGQWWVYKTFGQLGRETWLTRDQVRGALRQLIDQGIVIKRANTNRSAPLYRLSPVAIANALDAVGWSPIEDVKDDHDEWQE